MSKVKEYQTNEELRRHDFPVATERIYMGHAGVCPLPRVAAEALREFAHRAERDNQESEWANAAVAGAREAAAALIGAQPDEIALLGPTSLGLSLVANGLSWNAGDEVVFYGDDYPANVYPWHNLERHGVKPVRLTTDAPGVITWDAVEAVLTERTRLVSLATCNFLSGYRIDINGIGKRLHERGILFCLDAIQTVGAFPTPVEHVDFLSADSHKWMLGPSGAGIVYVRKALFGDVRPTLLGSMNVYSPDFVAQEDIKFYGGARRYEPGAYNLPGIVAMEASMRLLLDMGQDAISAQLLELRRALVEGLRNLGYHLYIGSVDDDSDTTDASRSAIVTVHHPDREMEPLFEVLKEKSITASLRKNRGGHAFLRFSPHFYNTMDDVDRVVEAMR